MIRFMPVTRMYFQTGMTSLQQQKLLSIFIIRARYLTNYSTCCARGGLGIMTKLIRDKESFSHGHYIRGLTHVCFFSRGTFAYIAQKYTTSFFFIEDDVILL